ncbi:MAG: hypothetical protein EpisKO_07210 [Epibacterium sp.]
MAVILVSQTAAGRKTGAKGQVWKAAPHVQGAKGPGPPAREEIWGNRPAQAMANAERSLG